MMEIKFKVQKKHKNSIKNGREYCRPTTEYAYGFHVKTKRILSKK